MLRCRMAWAAMAATLATPALTSAAADAASIAPARPCFVSPSANRPAGIRIVGSGFPARDEIAIAGNGVAAGALTTANGTFSLLTRGPRLATAGPGYRTYTIRAFDTTHPLLVPVVRTTIRIANLAFAIHPTEARLSAIVRWSFSGFPSGRELYAHFTRGRRRVGDLRFGRTAGPCGTLTVRARLFPLSHVAPGTYDLQIDAARHYSPRTRPRTTGELTAFS